MIASSSTFCHNPGRVTWPLRSIAVPIMMGTIQPEDSGAAFEQKKRVFERLGMYGGKSPRHAQNPL